MLESPFPQIKLMQNSVVVTFSFFGEYLLIAPDNIPLFPSGQVEYPDDPDDESDMETEGEDGESEPDSEASKLNFTATLWLLFVTTISVKIWWNHCSHSFLGK